MEGPLEACFDLEEPGTVTASIESPEGAWTGFHNQAGDPNGDGIDDLVVCHYSSEPGTGHDSSYTYRLHLFHGPLEGQLVASEASAAAVLMDEGTGPLATFSQVRMGDVNDDGMDDLLIGAPSRTPGADEPGRACLVPGPLSGSASVRDAHTTFEEDPEVEGAGALVSAGGDLDGDGVGDMLIAAGNTCNGGLYLFRGPPPEGIVSVLEGDAVLSGSPMGETDRMSVGDMDGDGHDDVMVSDGCGYGACCGAIRAPCGHRRRRRHQGRG